MIDPPEALLATMGIEFILTGDKMPIVGIERVREAAGLMERIDEKVASMIRGAGTYSMAPRKHDYKALLERFTQPMPPEEIQAIIDAFPEQEYELSGPFSLLVQHVFSQVQALLPVSSINGIAGPRNIQPTDDRVWHFWNQVAALDNPLRVIDLIGAAALLKSQVAAMRDVYPTLSQYIDNAIIEKVVDAKAENESFQLKPKAEIGVTTWRGGKVLPFAPPKPPEAPPSKPAKGNDKMTEDLKTVGQSGAET